MQTETSTQFAVNSFNLFELDGRWYVMVIHNTSLMGVDEVMTSILEGLVGRQVLGSVQIRELVVEKAGEADADSLIEELLTFEILEDLGMKADREAVFAKLDTQLAELPVANFSPDNFVLWK